jgi:hypothetical protein
MPWSKSNGSHNYLPILAAPVGSPFAGPLTLTPRAKLRYRHTNKMPVIMRLPIMRPWHTAKHIRRPE